MANKLFTLPAFFFLILMCSFNVSASEAVGGEISYKYVGNTTGMPDDYEITLTFYRINDTNGIPAPTTANISVNSSCFSTYITLSPVIPVGKTIQDWGTPFPADLNCGDTSSTGYFLEIYKFRGVVTLQACSDYVLSFKQCCRSSNIDNLQSPGMKSFYIESHLNNIMGHNSSPEFMSYPIYSYCTNRKAILPTGINESDGDSINYELISVLSDVNTPISYYTGYSLINAISPTAPFSTNNGVTSVIPDQPGVYTLAIRVNEYRYDPTLATHYKIGSIMRDYTITIAVNCNNPFTSNVFGNNVMDTVSSVFCEDTLIEIDVDPILINSLAINGTDFEIRDSQNNLVAISEAGYSGNSSDLSTNKIWLKLAKPIDYNDNFKIYLQTGTDGNTLVSKCGAPYPAQDSVLLVVDDCQEVNLNENHIAGNSIYPNPVVNTLIVKLPKSFATREIQIMDLQGKVLKSIIPVAGKMQIDVSYLPAGIYFISTKNDSQELIGKFHKL